MLWLWASTILCWAEPTFRLAPMSTDAVAAQREKAKESGDLQASWACHVFVEKIDFCFILDTSEENMPYVTEGMLQDLQLTKSNLWDWMEKNGQSYVNVTRYSQEKVDGVDGYYFASTYLDGRDALGWFYPEKLQKMVGGEVLAAQPDRGVFLFWNHQMPELTRAVTIGVKEVYKQAAHPISPYVYIWNGQSWQVWGEAVEKESIDHKEKKE